MNLVVMQQLSGSTQDYQSLLAHTQQVTFQQRSLLSRIGLRRTYCEPLLQQSGGVAVFDFWEQESDYQQANSALHERNLKLVSASPHRLLYQTSQFILAKAMFRENFLPQTATALLLEAEPGFNLDSISTLLRSTLPHLWPDPTVTALWLGQNPQNRHQFLLHILWNKASRAAEFLAEGGLPMPYLRGKLKLRSYATALPLPQLTQRIAS